MAIKSLLKKISEANTIEELALALNININRAEIDISYRGGGIGFRSGDIAELVGVDADDLPNKFGAGCNYLGGGLRGAIFPSGYNQSITGKKAELLDAISQACIRAYESIENDAGLNSEEDEDGETNWEAMGTNRCRHAGVVSAY